MDSIVFPTGPVHPDFRLLIQFVTQAQYDALPAASKSNPAIVYFIYK